MEKIKLPFISDYSFLEQCELDVAESILGEYNDFVLYNYTQYNNMFKIKDKDVGIEDEKEEEEVAEDKNAEHFRKLFLNRDFAESCLVGVKIEYYALQEKLIKEQRDKVAADQSYINEVAPFLRDCCSTLIIGEKVHKLLVKMEASQTIIEEAKANIAKSLEFLSYGFVYNMPEYTKYKERIASFKTAEGLLKMSAKVLETAELGYKFYKGKESKILNYLKEN